jgi:hypothetical protein
MRPPNSYISKRWEHLIHVADIMPQPHSSIQLELGQGRLKRNRADREGIHRVPFWEFSPLFLFLWINVIFFFVVLGFELRALHLLSRHFATRAILSSLFDLVIVQIRVSHFGQGASWTMIPIPMPPAYLGSQPQPQPSVTGLFVEMGSHYIFARLASNCDPPNLWRHVIIGTQP